MGRPRYRVLTTFVHPNTQLRRWQDRDEHPRHSLQLSGYNRASQHSKHKKAGSFAAVFMPLKLSLLFGRRSSQCNIAHFPTLKSLLNVTGIENGESLEKYVVKI